MTVASVLVIDDRIRSAAALSAWLAAGGAQVAVSATWAEAADTLAYQKLAGTALPGLVVGPLAVDGVKILADLRGQGIELPTAFYTETKSRDQDETLKRQYGLVAILHKPFADEDRGLLLGSEENEGPAPAPADLPPMPAAPTPSPSSGRRDAFDDLIGSSRGSSVRADAPPPKAKLLKAEELPSGVQRLLVDPMAGQQPADGPKKAEEEKQAGPRSIAILAVEDKFGSARLLVERLGMPGQLTRAVPGYAEALSALERMLVGSLGCELVIGPLSAEGVAAVREYRKRNWPTHVVFYTESATQSQDPRLTAQYGALAIVRRSGMAEQLERLVADLRAKPKQPPAVPTEAAPGRSSSGREAAAAAVRTSGLHAVEPQAAAPSPAPAPKPAVGRTSGIFAAPPAAPAPVSAPSATSTGVSSRVRRSITLPPNTPAPAAEAPAQAPLEIDVGPAEASASQARTRVFKCAKCKKEFVAEVKPLAKVSCPHCGAANG